MKIRSNIVKLLVAPFLCCLMFLSVGCGMKKRSRMHESDSDEERKRSNEEKEVKNLLGRIQSRHNRVEEAKAELAKPVGVKEAEHIAAARKSAVDKMMATDAVLEEYKSMVISAISEEIILDGCGEVDANKKDLIRDLIEDFRREEKRAKEDLKKVEADSEAATRTVELVRDAVNRNRNDTLEAAKKAYKDVVNDVSDQLYTKSVSEFQELDESLCRAYDSLCELVEEIKLEVRDFNSKSKDAKLAACVDASEAHVEAMETVAMVVEYLKRLEKLHKQQGEQYESGVRLVSGMAKIVALGNSTSLKGNKNSNGYNKLTAYGSACYNYDLVDSGARTKVGQDIGEIYKTVIGAVDRILENARKKVKGAQKMEQNIFSMACSLSEAV